jgi:exosome complex RNA-binding protein Csl4
MARAVIYITAICNRCGAKLITADDNDVMGMPQIKVDPCECINDDDGRIGLYPEELEVYLVKGQTIILTYVKDLREQIYKVNFAGVTDDRKRVVGFKLDAFGSGSGFRSFKTEKILDIHDPISDKHYKLM